MSYAANFSYLVGHVGTTGNPQTTNLAAGDHVEWRAFVTYPSIGRIKCTTGAGQAAGLLSLEPGTYRVAFGLDVEFNAINGVATIGFYNFTAGANAVSIDGSEIATTHVGTQQPDMTVTAAYISVASLTGFYVQILATSIPITSIDWLSWLEIRSVDYPGT